MQRDAICSWKVDKSLDVCSIREFQITNLYPMRNIPVCNQFYNGKINIDSDSFSQRSLPTWLEVVVWCWQVVAQGHHLETCQSTCGENPGETRTTKSHLTMFSPLLVNSLSCVVLFHASVFLHGNLGIAVWREIKTMSCHRSQNWKKKNHPGRR